MRGSFPARKLLFRVCIVNLNKFDRGLCPGAFSEKNSTRFRSAEILA